MYRRRPRRWSDLPPDLVREISLRLHDAGDFVRFHAVCTPWREYLLLDPLPRTQQQQQQFLPWLLAPDKKRADSLNLRCVFSKATFRAPPPAHRGCNWVAAADGTAVRYFSDCPSGLPGLHDPLTGAVTRRLPFFPKKKLHWLWEENLGGIVYGDGAVLLYNDPHEDDDDWFRVALLRPGGTDGDHQWTVVERTFEEAYYGECRAAYHGGRILLTVEASLWHVVSVPPDGATATSASDDVLVPRSWLPGEDEDYDYHYSYVLESRGELLWVSLQLLADCCRLLLARALKVSVHVLEEGEDGAPQWVRKEDYGGRSLADRVLFLGWPNSFAVDASRLGVDGGCAYFVFEDEDGPPHQRFGVFRYDLVHDEAVLLEWLPKGWDDVMCTWLVPRPHCPDPGNLQEIAGWTAPKTAADTSNSNEQYYSDR
ncbi:uncharacterized protein LOC112270771 [Brachypodium distachyon]|uniref:KIB1-4 beta-propeller domain-containing protein n=1 Tax=Brachypodium distachyon TaxID=15368 RepID=A0A2K2DGP7_BRADI|nr:uncharacterized protein LOC112270771 [Brachypodium distachyon]PNT73450.1 hypothetical protein BRADI_2g58622v3 [Brachypodium distachyon]|eukprot:XP_024314643.1 uncharacterized protein LOC112270771 [Brachypodium distachyon]